MKYMYLEDACHLLSVRALWLKCRMSWLRGSGWPSASASSSSFSTTMGVFCMESHASYTSLAISSTHLHTLLFYDTIISLWHARWQTHSMLSKTTYLPQDVLHTATKAHFTDQTCLLKSLMLFFWLFSNACLSKTMHWLCTVFICVLAGYSGKTKRVPHKSHMQLVILSLSRDGTLKCSSA